MLRPAGARGGAAAGGGADRSRPSPRNYNFAGAPRNYLEPYTVYHYAAPAHRYRSAVCAHDASRAARPRRPAHLTPHTCLSPGSSHPRYGACCMWDGAPLPHSPAETSPLPRASCRADTVRPGARRAHPAAATACGFCILTRDSTQQARTAHARTCARTGTHAQTQVRLNTTEP